VYSIKPLAEAVVELHGDAFSLAPGSPLPRGLSAEGVSEDFSTEPPLSLYGSTKVASEVLALEYGETFDFPVWINRCGVLAGAGQFGRPDQGIFAFWINAWLRRQPLSYLGFDGNGYQVRDALHPRDLTPLLRMQVLAPSAAPRVVNLGGGIRQAMSLAQLSAWCGDRFGPHEVARDGKPRRFDIPWLVMDTARARDTWGWQPTTSLAEMLDEIAVHAEEHPEWLELSGALP
jgi:CDP-paratose 2-epimerase